MQTDAWSFARKITRRQWTGLAVSLGLGGLLVALLFAGLAPRPAAAAGSSEPVTAYACTEGDLDEALAAGGSASFTCGGLTTVTVSNRKVVTKNVSLDGGNQLVLSGGSLTGVFSVSAG